MPQPNPTVHSVADVYDLASAIGKEFELLIDKHGADSLSNLMPKVIVALENLESLASRAEAANEQLLELRQCIDRMELERAARLTDRGRFELEMEQADQECRRELQRLRDQNRSLQQALDEALRRHRSSRNSSAASSDLSVGPSSPQLRHQQQQQQLVSLARLKAALNIQRDETRSLRRELANSKADCEALQAQSDRLATLNAELMKRLGKNEDGTDCPRLAAKQPGDSEIEAENHQGDEVLSSSLSPLPQLSSAVPASEAAEAAAAPATASEPASPLDPNRPRFTLAELRAVLAERNELKARLMEAEDELLACRQTAIRGPSVAMSSFEEDSPVSPDQQQFDGSFDSQLNASSAQLLTELTSTPASPSGTMSSLRRGVFDGLNDSGVEGGGSSSSSTHHRRNSSGASNSSDLGIKYFVFRLICHLRKRFKRSVAPRRSWS